MEYAVIRHGDMDSVVVFMKALDDGAVYFKNKAGTHQWIINLPTSNGRGGDIAFELRKQLRAKGLTAQADEINKAAQSLLSVIKHTDESSDDEIIIDEGVEIIDAPYPEHGKAQIPRRCFIYDDEDGYPEGYQGFIEHHGILGMKWGVRRYQNADGSLTDAGRRHYGRNYTIRELKKNIQDPNLSYSEKKALVSANKVNRMTKTKYRNAVTSVTTAATGVAGAGTLAGLMAAGILSVNPLLPIAALAGGVASGKAINAGREFLNAFRDLRVEMIDRMVDKQRTESKDSKVKDQIKKIDLLSEKNMSKPEYKDRADAAAELGIKALNKMGNDGGDPKNKNVKEWFLYEDQTIGLPTIADMVRSGYTKNEIKKTIANATSDSELYEVSDINGNLRPSIEKYLDACIDIVNEEKKK